MSMRSALDLSRRSIILAAPTLLLARAADAALMPTPRQTEGPFYPRELPGDGDFDLTVFGLDRPEGRVIEIVGRATDARARPLSDAIVEIWQADARGLYAHVGMPGGDPNFQGFGAVRVGRDGAYRFRTVLPGLYTGRTRHIHVKVRGPEGELTTQMYFPGETLNAVDGLYLRLSEAGRAAVTAAEEPGDPPRFRFDIVTAS